MTPSHLLAAVWIDASKTYHEKEERKRRKKKKNRRKKKEKRKKKKKKSRPADIGSNKFWFTSQTTGNLH
jgi:cytochrome b subunit of formate dehydrogenase